jgi:teichuronic acid biosynthesis glycosyltransferase TuaG
MSLVSIIIPYYKKELYLEQSIRSILNQTYQNFEIILINDDPENKIFISKFSKLDHRIKLVHNENNLGAGLSRNKGLEIANGEYIAFCDSDDLWKNNKIEFQIEFMKRLNFTFSFTGYDIIDENNNFIKSRKAPSYVDFQKLRSSCDIGLSTVMIRKDVFENVKYRFANLRTKEDYVLWLKLAEDKITMKSIQENLTSWRKSKNSLSSSVIQKIVDGYKVYRIYLKYSRLRSLYHLVILSINFILKN